MPSLIFYNTIFRENLQLPTAAINSIINVQRITSYWQITQWIIIISKFEQTKEILWIWKNFAAQLSQMLVCTIFIDNF